MTEDGSFDTSYGTMTLRNISQSYIWVMLVNSTCYFSPILDILHYYFWFWFWFELYAFACMCLLLYTYTMDHIHQFSILFISHGYIHWIRTSSFDLEHWINENRIQHCMVWSSHNIYVHISNCIAFDTGSYIEQSDKMITHISRSQTKPNQTMFYLHCKHEVLRT